MKDKRVEAFHTCRLQNRKYCRKTKKDAQGAIGFGSVIEINLYIS
jgi:hypothetical protein